MASEAQLAANRANAQKCTGPRSDAGKQRSRLNALKSGVHAVLSIIPGEDPSELDTLRSEYYDEHAPLGTEERLQVDTMIRSEWQLRRLARIEAELYLYKSVESADHRYEHCKAGQLYFKLESELARLTRQVATYHKCYREAAAELKKLKLSRAQNDLDETKPISQLTPAPSTQPPTGLLPFQLAPNQSPVRATDHPAPVPIIVPSSSNPAAFPRSTED